MSAQEAVEVTLPERAFLVTVRFFTVTGHQFKDVELLADDYLRRKEDGSLDAYLETRVIRRLKREWYPFPSTQATGGSFPCSWPTARTSRMRMHLIRWIAIRCLSRTQPPARPGSSSQRRLLRCPRPPRPPAGGRSHR
jgi:hypothetical protein